MLQNSGKLLEASEDQNGLWKVVQNIVTVATVVSIYVVYEDTRSVAARALREHEGVFTFASYISPHFPCIRSILETRLI